ESKLVGEFSAAVCVCQSVIVVVALACRGFPAQTGIHARDHGKITSVHFWKRPRLCENPDCKTPRKKPTPPEAVEL
ncbi:MAG: hypothetical protein GXP14_15205, partial [Gammaproteobacteria bacterium]|nr:hypothetical protein [Gammaproteobacteria bacterium]